MNPETHEVNPKSLLQPNTSEKNQKPPMIDGGTLQQFLFFIVGIGMLVGTALTRNWCGTLIISMILVAGFILVSRGITNKNKKLNVIWSDFASQIYMELRKGQSDICCSLNPPNVSGIYHGRRFSVTLEVEHMFVDEGFIERTIPVIYTSMSLDVMNPRNCSFSVSQKPFYKKLFKLHGTTSGDEDLDRHFQFKGHPVDFLQKAIQWIVQHPMLLNRPDNVIISTDDDFSSENWTPPTIQL